MRYGVRVFWLGFALVVCPLTSHADRASSLELYEAGRQQYEAGKYDAAVDSFRAAYDEHPASEYLFNIAQAYRKLGDCPQALDYYERFARTDPPAKAAEVVARHIRALAEQCGPDNATIDPALPPPGEVAVTARVSSPAADAPPSWLLSAGVGPTLHDIGEVRVPVGIGFHLGLGHRLPVDRIAVSAGIAADFSPMRYDDAMSGVAYLLTAVANVSAAVDVPRSFRVRGEIGVGDVLLGGLGDGNPFTADGGGSSALHMLSVRVSAGLEFAPWRRLAIGVSPVLVYSRSHGDLASDIGAILRTSLLVRVSYGI